MCEVQIGKRIRHLGDGYQSTFVIRILKRSHSTLHSDDLSMHNVTRLKRQPQCQSENVTRSIILRYVAW